MLRIGEFSTMSKVTIKTLRYYEKEGILTPSFVDEENGYRFYETKQLLTVSKIVSLRQIGMSIDNIKTILAGGDMQKLLTYRKQELEAQLALSYDQLQRIDYILEGKNMDYEVVIKELPEYVVYYKEGRIDDFGALQSFILDSAKECYATNPDIKCIEPDYCFVSYLDGEYRPNNMHILYAQAVTKAGVENDTIKFKKLTAVQGASVYHKGSYDALPDAYGYITNWIEENGYEITEPVRECYIDGVWNKEDINDWLTEIQIPIKKVRG